MKKIIVFSFILMLLSFLWACNKEIELDIPANFNIQDSIITFDEVDLANNYRIELVNEEDNSLLRRVVKSGDNMNDLSIPEGSYLVKLQAVGNKTNIKDSKFTELVSYQQLPLNVKSSISETDLIDGLYIKWMGRTHYNESTKVNMIYHSTSGFEVIFKGTSVTATITATKTEFAHWRPYIVIVLDDDFDNAETIALDQPINNIVLVDNINDDKEHKLTIYKRSESIDSHIGLKDISVDGSFIQKINYKERKIEVIAASSSTGFGNLGTTLENKTSGNSDALKAYAFLSSQALNADLNIVAASGWGVKASRWTTPNTLNMFDAYKKVDMFSTVNWSFSKYIPDVVVMNLGTNDWSYVMATEDLNEQKARMDAFKKQYYDFIIFINAMYPDAQIIILYGLMNEHNIYEATEEIYDDAKKVVSNLHLFKINGDAKGCSYHPSAQSHQAIAIALTNKIKEIMNW